MKLTGLQIIKLANRHTEGDEIDYPDAIDWINECLTELGEDARVFDNFELVISDTKTWYDLPVNMIRIHEFEDSNGNVSYVNYTIRNGKIKVDAIGTYNIYYAKLPTEIEIEDETDEEEIETALSQEIDCHKMLQKVVPLFIASRFKIWDDEDSKDSQRLMQEFEMRKAQALKQINDLDNYNNFSIRVI